MLKQWLTYAGLRLALALLGILPEPIMRRLGQAAGSVWYVVDGRRRRVVHRHMSRLGGDRAGAREVFQSYGRYWAESFWARPRRLDRMWENMDVEGLEHLDAAVEEGRGAVVVLPHVGNWEAAALIGRHKQLRLVAVAEKLANRRITEWFTRQRNMFGIEIVLTGNGRVTPLLREAIEAGKLVCLLSDRDLSGRGVEVEFFGEKTTLPAGPVALARKTGVPALPVAVYFREGRGHHAVILPPLDLTETKLADGVQEIARHLEALIGRDPGQWHLVQPNWPSDRDDPS